MIGTTTLPHLLAGESANERLKHDFGTSLWRSLALAALLHFLVLAFWPQMRAIDASRPSDELVLVEVAAEIEIPPPPEEITRPAVPILSTDLNIADEITIDPNTFRDNPVSTLPPPPVGRMNVTDEPAFTPYEVKPELRNRAEFQRDLQRNYPAMLRDAGIGGTVILWVRIDEGGAVLDTRVITGSGNDALDDLAQRLMRETARFSPALNRDQRVTVWIQMPVTFQTR